MKYLLVFSFLLTTTVSSWNLKKDKDGIKVYTTTVEGSSYKKFKATAKLNSKLSDAVKFVFNPMSSKLLSKETEKVKVLKKEDKKITYYLSVLLPWPVTNRDGVYQMNIEKQTETYAKISIKALPDYLPKDDDYVRVPESNGYWEFTENNGELDVVYSLHTESGGSIPGWIANSFVVDVPFGVLSKLKKLLEK